jgi:hypothetical protein
MTKDATCIAFKSPGEKDWLEIGKGEDKRKDLNNLLLTSLQMQNLVVLAGSGCSRAAGGPSMMDLWNATVGATASDEAKSTATKVRHDLADKNIEAFLSRVEAFLQVNEDDAVKKFLTSCKKGILEKCGVFLKPEKLNAHRTFIHRLSRRRMRDRRLKLFTTNYDLCFEQAASELGGVAMDGFSFRAPRHYDPHFFDYDIIRRPSGGEGLGNYLPGVFLLYKLHGSVNWARVNGTIQEDPEPKPEEVCLIYPASGKYQQSFAQPHLESIAQYLGTVREPNTCLLVVGFGFNDNHLSEPLLAAAQSNPHLRVVIVDPKAEEKTANGTTGYWGELNKLGEKGEDIWFINASFNEFSEMIPDLKANTPAENLIKAIKGVANEP